MQKTFLKFVVYELIERIARADYLLADCARMPDKVSPALITALQQQSTALKTQVLADQAFLSELFTDAPLPDNSLHHWLKDDFGVHYKTLSALSTALNSLYKGALLPETNLFLKDAAPEELSEAFGPIAIVTTPENHADPVAGVPVTGVLLSHLPLLQKNNPLGWTTLIQGLCKQLAKTSPALEAVKPRLKKVLDHNEAVVETMLMHALALRLLGPAYYFSSLADAVFNRDAVFFNWVEPALFIGLNHLGLTSKSLVILHEAAERSKPVFLKSWGAEDDGVVDKDAITALFNAVERAIPDKHAFTQKQFERALLLQERLAQGTLLSASPIYPVEEVSVYFEEMRATGEVAIYDALARMTETPHTAREVLNAGWVYKAERAPVWLYSTVAVQGEDYDGFERLRELIEGTDILLQKSIETSELHKMLLCSV